MLFILITFFLHRCIAAFRQLTDLNQKLINNVPAQVMSKKEPLTEQNRNNKENVPVKAEPVKVQVNLVDYLTVGEFDKVPKYMKGRLSYDCLTKAVDEFNKCLEDKYVFLAKPLNSLGLKEKKKRALLKSQDKPDLKNKHFVTGDDLKDFSMFKTEGSRKSVVTVLRHFQKIREVRGPGPIVRFVVC